MPKTKEEEEKDEEAIVGAAQAVADAQREVERAFENVRIEEEKLEDARGWLRRATVEKQQALEVLRKLHAS